MLKIAPSVLASDFSRLGKEAEKMQLCGADYLHLDVMDGHFVPNISFGAPIIASIRKRVALVFDVHLMIENPLDYVGDFAAAGADIITIHTECSSPISETIDKILSLGCKAALSVKPKTDISAVYPYLDKIAMVLVMSVEPGFGGQAFMPETMDKVRALKEEILSRRLTTDIEVDGGINEQTAAVAAAAGANVFVAGSAVFGAKKPEVAIANLRAAARANCSDCC